MPDRDYPCPICHKTGCAHLIGFTTDGTFVQAGGQVVGDVHDTDVVFGTTLDEGGARVYRRLHSAAPKGSNRHTQRATKRQLDESQSQPGSAQASDRQEA